MVDEQQEITKTTENKRGPKSRTEFEKKRDEIIAQLGDDIDRVKNLCDVSQSWKEPDKAENRGRKKASRSDVLRGAVTLLHAGVETFFRNLLILTRLSDSAKKKYRNLDDYSIKGKMNIEFKMSDFIEFDEIQEEQIDRLIEILIKNHIRKNISFSNAKKIKKALEDIGIGKQKIDKFFKNEYVNFENITNRRHQIVHHGDRDPEYTPPEVKGDYNFKHNTITLGDLDRYVSVVVRLQEFVKKNKKDIV